MTVRDPSKYFTNHVEIHLHKKVEGKDEDVKERHISERRLGTPATPRMTVGTAEDFVS